MGSLKNEIVAHCEKKKISVNAWLVEVTKSALRDEKGLPDPPPARIALPTILDEIRSYASGERIMMPCGKYEPCAAVLKKHNIHDGMHFCSECGIRVI